MNPSHCNSLLLLSKPPGVTSFSSLYPVKKLFKGKVGHAGTLDKFAEGLLVVLTGSFTRLNPLFSSLDKKYLATICFGTETDTLDPEGTVIRTGPIPSLDTIEEVLAGMFKGSVLQRPPQYSAIHLDGQRAHKLARSGKEVEMPFRSVVLFETDVVSWDPPSLKLAVHCSKGTYIRSLARDLGHACGSCAYLSNLMRTAIGPYQVEEAKDPYDAESLREMVFKSHELIARLGIFATIIIDDHAATALAMHGTRPAQSSILKIDGTPSHTHALILDIQGNLIAISEYQHSINQEIRILTAVLQREVDACR